MAGRKRSDVPSKRRQPEVLDYHEGLSANQVKILLAELGLDESKFSEWMHGQTSPLLVRKDDKGRDVLVCGYYEYDVFRWVANQRKGTPLIFD